jgi:hypothetical protein
MEFENLFTTAVTSNKLKDLRVETISFFSRDYRGSKDNEIDQHEESLYAEDNVNCYTAAETIDDLPRYVVKDGFSLELQIIRSSVWRFGYGDPSHAAAITFTAGNDDTLAEAAGKFRIYLIENDFGSPKDAAKPREAV